MIIIENINANEANEAFNVPRSKPPLARGLVRKSPKVAPNGLVKTNAIQNNITRFSLVK